MLPSSRREAFMKIEDLLPIGSVIILKGGEKKLMIFGVKQSGVKESTEYDYIGVVYPEGNLGEDYQFLFNHEDIEQVVFKGYEDDERNEFLKKLSKFYE